MSKPVLPDPRVLATTQDRLIEKEFVDNLEIATAPYAPSAMRRSSSRRSVRSACPRC